MYQSVTRTVYEVLYLAGTGARLRLSSYGLFYRHRCHRWLA